MNEAPRPLPDVMAEFAPRAGLGPEHVHDLAMVQQSQFTARAEEAIFRAATASTPRQADAHMGSALSSIKALLVAAASLGHLADSVFAATGKAPPPWLKAVEGIVDELDATTGG